MSRGKQRHKVVPYTIQELKHLLCVHSGAHPSIVDNKPHAAYFENYFTELNALTIVAEYDYIDKDFLDDFSAYYVKCFAKYNSTCTRIHFLDKAFTPRLFRSVVLNRGKKLREKDLQNSYLGFIVVKRLPETFIGRTCLKTYESDHGRRQYPLLKDYSVSLFGISLEVRNTLAYQEQDSTTAACATSALWTVFHGTSGIFNHPVPSPVEITKLATQIPEQNNPGTLPNHGLTGRQEIHAIQSLGLEPELTNAIDPFILKSSVYAYLRAGIPIVFSITLINVSDPNNHRPYRQTGSGHAVAITGYSQGLPNPTPYNSEQFLLRGSRINEIYAHDDQVGPFARMEFDGALCANISETKSDG